MSYNTKENESCECKGWYKNSLIYIYIYIYIKDNPLNYNFFLNNYSIL